GIAVLEFAFAAWMLASHPAPGGSPWIAVFPQSQELALRNHGVEVWGREGEVVVGGAGEAGPAARAGGGGLAALTVRDSGQWIYFLLRREGVPTGPAPPPGAMVRVLSPTTDLWLLPASSSRALPRMRKLEGSFLAVPRIPLAPVMPHAADLAGAVASPASVTPRVQQIVDATDQASWFTAIRELTGDLRTTVGGVLRTISTRHSDAMYPTPQTSAYATEYLLERAAAWGYTGVRETYTS